MGSRGLHEVPIVPLDSIFVQHVPSGKDTPIFKDFKVECLVKRHSDEKRCIVVELHNEGSATNRSSLTRTFVCNAHYQTFFPQFPTFQRTARISVHSISTQTTNRTLFLVCKTAIQDCCKDKMCLEIYEYHTGSGIYLLDLLRLDGVGPVDNRSSTD